VLERRRAPGRHSRLAREAVAATWVCGRVGR